MTTTTAPTRMGSSSGALAGTAASSAALAAAGTLYGANDWAEIGIVLGAIAVTTLLIFGFVVPRALRKESAGGAALTLSILAVLLVLPAFWSGLPLVLGTAGLVVGNAGRRASTGAGPCIAATVLGALAVVGHLAIYVAAAITGDAGFLFD